MSLNNIDIAQVKDYENEIKADPNEARFTTKMEGDWLFEEGGPQFTANAKTIAGPVTMSLSHPNFSGPGVAPSPMSFGLFWIAGCASATFMTSAEKKGIKIDAMHTTIEADLDYHAQFNLGNQPLISEYRINFEVATSASDAEVEELKADAIAGCMAMFTVRNAIPLKVSCIKSQ